MAESLCNYRPLDPEEAAEHAAFDHEAVIDDDFIDDLPGKGRHFVYYLHAAVPGVCPYAGSSVTVYVGVTSNLRARMRAHSKRWWWQCVLRDLVEFEECQSREHAEFEERRGIHFDNPDLNVSLGVGRKLSSKVVNR